MTKRNRDDIKGNVKMTISKSVVADFPKNKCFLQQSGTHKTEGFRLFLDKNAMKELILLKIIVLVSTVSSLGTHPELVAQEKFATKLNVVKIIVFFHTMLFF